MGASDFYQSTELGFLKGNYLLKLVLLPILSLNPSFWGVLPPKPRSALVFRWDAYTQLLTYL
ncbi:unknown protein [Microcystis aeruginosa NIES-843]|uniref:Uncharacterized protein n=1 Tax=Microcystis aeruginosa (strain NIES-843 / IAM M-2473) TaxID=449447 RepID=B0JQ76_MICAN|nr:unknown protein [Microcystis aeruginosa NIES-843]